MEVASGATRRVFLFQFLPSFFPDSSLFPAWLRLSQVLSSFHERQRPDVKIK